MDAPSWTPASARSAIRKQWQWKVSGWMAEWFKAHAWKACVR